MNKIMTENFAPGASVVITKDINNRLLDLKSRASSLVEIWCPKTGESLSGVFLGIREHPDLPEWNNYQLLLKNAKGMYAVWIGRDDFKKDIDNAALEEGDLLSLSYLGKRPQKSVVRKKDALFPTMGSSYDLTIENP
jgi:hypothetical protein